MPPPTADASGLAETDSFTVGLPLASSFGGSTTASAEGAADEEAKAAGAADDARGAAAAGGDAEATVADEAPDAAPALAPALPPERVDKNAAVATAAIPPSAVASAKKRCLRFAGAASAIV